MRLINCDTLKLEFHGLSTIQPYAILSHTWADGEVTFNDFHQENRKNMKGWNKIELTCRQALKDGLSYAWIDTCCIDKTSSSELSEAINSMFKWYALSAKCYAFLTDYSHSTVIDENFSNCKWFTRGWTLQELIAPPSLAFFDQNWALIGTKKSLSSQISQITKISEKILTATDFDTINTLLYSHTVAQRMSWAASRITTREEDIAYCMLGMFGINMPMLYGEGKRAFIRLQEEIIKESNDMTIFAWQTSGQHIANNFEEMSNSNNMRTHRGILAEGPAEFSNAHQFFPAGKFTSGLEYIITNKGLKFSNDLSLKPLSYDMYFMSLDCFWGKELSRSCGICLQNYGAGLFARAYPERLLLEPEGIHTAVPGQIYISKNLQSRERQALRENSRQAFRFSYRFSSTKYDCTVEATEPRNQWVAERGLFILTPGQSTFTGYHKTSWQRKENKKDIKNRKQITGGRFMALCGWNKGFEPWICITSSQEDPQLYQAAESMNLNFAGKLGANSGRIRTPLSYQFPPNAGITLDKNEETSNGTFLTVYNIQVWLGVDNQFPHRSWDYGYDEVPVHFM